ncbi:hypothetical protein QLQ12_45060 [Actinoplanes sp. NEAU-A12]|uniref:Lipoprotein n=1 Tax=Actinoplanes sandaracinus TaxID=3045177 RepID=A0ABT6X1R2_9ACTN|nr:hypothetical protein [Actinoplanes sandaracinus]MDI6105771.1 hypothetical protein [Actinoplanes sandaracinus]
MRFERALCALILVGLVGGCTSSSGDEGEAKPAVVDPAKSAATESGGSPPAWTEPGAYTYTLTRGCDAAKPLGRYQATVAAGAVTGATRVGASAASPAPSSEVDLGPVTGQEGEEIEVPTLGELVTMAQTASEDGAEVSTEFDRTDGHPVKVTINVAETPDGAECWSVSDYKPST